MLQCMDENEYESRLWKTRIDMRLAQKQLDEMTGVIRRAIGLIEAERYNPMLRLHSILLKMTGKSLGALFFNERALAACNFFWLKMVTYRPG